MKIMVSACLLGDNVKYNGGNNYRSYLKELENKNEVLLICPEMLAGFNTPRTPFELRNNRAINKDGIDITEVILKGCNDALKLIKEKNPNLKFPVAI